VVFRDYLKTIIENSHLPVPLQFISSIASMPPSETFTPRSLSSIPHPTPLTFKPTTPLFYALLARQSDFPSFLRTTLANQTEDSKTTIFHTSDPDLLLQLFDESGNPSKETTPLTPVRPSLINSCLWDLIQRLRKQDSQLKSSVSPLDDFAMHLPRADAHRVRAYRLATLRLLASDYVAFGLPGLIDTALVMVRMWLCWLCVQSLDTFLGLREELDQSNPYVLGKVVLKCVGMPLWAAVGALL